MQVKMLFKDFLGGGGGGFEESTPVLAFFLGNSRKDVIYRYYMALIAFVFYVWGRKLGRVHYVTQ